MNFVYGLPITSRRNDGIWVIVDRLTKSAHFIPVREKYSSTKLADIFMDNIVSKHGVPVSITSDRDPRFTSRSWRQFHEELGARLNFSTAFHPQTDGQSERTIQTLEDMLRAYILQHKVQWDKDLPLVEFTYNNSFHSSIDMAPYEALYRKRCRTPLYWDEVGEKKLKKNELLQKAHDKIKVIKEKLKTARDRQKSYADHRRKDLEFEIGDLVFLKLSPWKGVMRFTKRSKLNPRYIGPYQIIERVGAVAYRLALPDDMARIHNVFHVSMLRKCIGGTDVLPSDQRIELRQDLSYDEYPISIVDKKVKQLRSKAIPLVKVTWNNHGEEEATWETEEEMRAKYPHLFQKQVIPSPEEEGEEYEEEYEED